MERYPKGFDKVIDIPHKRCSLCFSLADREGSSHIESEGFYERVTLEYDLYGNISTLSLDGAYSRVPVTIEKSCEGDRRREFW